MSQTKAQVNKLLTNVSNGLFPKGYAADKVFPQLMVKQSSGILGGYGLSHLRASDDLIGGRSEARRVDAVTRDISKTYLIQKHALEGVVTQDDYDNVEDPFSAESDETLGLTHRLLTNKEKVTADLLFNTTTFSGKTTTPSTKYSDYSSSDPLVDFKTAHNAILTNCGQKANAAIVSRLVANTLMFHPQLLDRLGFKYNSEGLLNDEQIKVCLGVDELIIADAPYNSAKEGQTDVLAQLWSDGILFYVKPSSAAKYQVSLGYQMKQIGSDSKQVYKYDLNNPVGASGIIVQEAYQMKIIDANAGYFLNDVLA